MKIPATSIFRAIMVSSAFFLGGSVERVLNSGALGDWLLIISSFCIMLSCHISVVRAERMQKCACATCARDDGDCRDCGSPLWSRHVDGQISDN